MERAAATQIGQDEVEWASMIGIENEENQKYMKRKRGEDSDFDNEEEKTIKIEDSDEEEEEEVFTLTIKPLLGESFDIQVQSMDTVYIIKEKIYEKMDIPVEFQILHYAGGILADGKTIDSLGLMAYSTLRLTIKLSSGADTYMDSEFEGEGIILFDSSQDYYIQFLFKVNQSEEDCVNNEEKIAEKVVEDNSTLKPLAERNECSLCKKKLRLTNQYVCRCNGIFCNAHRFNDKHDCPFDFQEYGKKLIEKDIEFKPNPYNLPQ